MLDSLTTHYRRPRDRYTSVFSTLLTPKDQDCIKELPTWGAYRGTVTSNLGPYPTLWTTFTHQTTLRKVFKGLVTGVVTNLSTLVSSGDSQTYGRRTVSKLFSVFVEVDMKVTLWLREYQRSTRDGQRRKKQKDTESKKGTQEVILGREKGSIR